MNEKNGKRLAEKKRFKQKKMLAKMEKEIKNLEFNIKNANLVNRKKIAVRNLKISARALQRVAPYVVTAGIVTGTFTLLGDIPFYPDDMKKNLEIMTEFDTDGNIRTERQYDSFRENSELYYYSDWKQDDDGLYSRNIQGYSINDKTYDDIMNLLDKEDLSLEDIFGKPFSDIKETKNNLTDEELQEGSFIQGVIYNKDRNEYIIKKQPIVENILLSILYLIVVFFWERGILDWRRDYSNFSYYDCVEKIREQYKPVDIDFLKKKLKLKKDNYNRMTR